MSYDLAQVNIGRLAYGLDSPRLADFVNALDPVNAEADTAPGFLWRLQTEDGNATSVAGFAADQGAGVAVIINMSTWRDVESLAAFVYGPMHAAIMRRRREWFLQIEDAYMACWWVPSGLRPTVPEAEERVALLRRDGPTPASFTLKRHFPAPGTAGPGTAGLGTPSPVHAIERDEWMCGV
jgi:hypothetical protein